MKIDLKTVEDGVYWLSKGEFEDFLETTDWDKEIKDKHREEFQGKVEFFEDGVSYK